MTNFILSQTERNTKNKARSDLLFEGWNDSVVAGRERAMIERPEGSKETYKLIIMKNSTWRSKSR